MDRRSFLTLFNGSQGTEYVPASSLPRPESTGLEAYVPSANAPWDAIRAGHLLRRTTMLPRWADIGSVLAMSPSAAVDVLLNTSSVPAEPSMANHDTSSEAGLNNTLIAQLQATWAQDAATLRKWWSATMRDSGLSIVEKLTMFWSGHFTSEFLAGGSYVLATLLYRQNKLLRENGLKNFQDLTFYVTLDGAMLVYLGGNLNTKGAPNENYAREVMELFTMGLGWYTEGDIHNAARVLTGWKVGQYNNELALNGIFNPYFWPADHDTENKQFLGVTIPARDATTNTEFLVKKDEIRLLTDTIFQVRPQAVAKFICTKLYKFFVYSNPAGTDDAVISAMADLFIQNNFEIKPVLSALLKSAHFFDNANIGAQIKTPAEFVIGLERQLALITDVSTSMSPLGQLLFDPPNVSGWPGYHDWITTNTFPVRSELATSVITAMDDPSTMVFIQQFANYKDPSGLIDSVAALLLPRPLSKERKDAFVGKLLGGAMPNEWSSILLTSSSTAARNMRDVLSTITDLPDFQLC